MKFSKSPRVPACSSILNIFISTNTAMKCSDCCTELKWLVKKKLQFDFACSLSLTWQYVLTLPRRNNFPCYYLPVNFAYCFGIFFPSSLFQLFMRNFPSDFSNCLTNINIFNFIKYWWSLFKILCFINCEMKWGTIIRING